MKVFDFNIHLYSKNADDVGGISEDTAMRTSDLISSFTSYKNHFDEHVIAGNFMCFNEALFKEADATTFVQLVASEMNNSVATHLLNFRSDTLTEDLERIKALGFKAIKFHSYVQSIWNAEIELAAKAAKIAADLGFFICIDCSFGTSKMYSCDNLMLAAAIADQVTESAIVLLHSGGLRVTDAMLLAEDKQNVFLETSLSLEYYEGSPLLQDYKFAYKKLGASRLLYASDFPFVTMDKSLVTAHEIFDKIGFSSTEQELVFHDNARNLIGG